MKYEICVRAMAHLTKEVTIEASSPDEAQRQAESLIADKPLAWWDVGEPEDHQVESVSPSKIRVVKVIEDLGEW